MYISFSSVLRCFCFSGSYCSGRSGMAVCAHLHQSRGKQNTQATCWMCKILYSFQTYLLDHCLITEFRMVVKQVAIKTAVLQKKIN